MHALTLMFHDVVPEGHWNESGFIGADADLYKLNCAEFRHHLEAIHRNLRGEFTTARELLAGNVPDSPFLLSFDDGGVSASTCIADILEEFGWRGHFLIPASRIASAGFLDGAPQRTAVRLSPPAVQPTRLAFRLDAVH